LLFEEEKRLREACREIGGEIHDDIGHLEQESFNSRTLHLVHERSSDVPQKDEAGAI
jgi:hypothetical protein